MYQWCQLLLVDASYQPRSRVVMSNRTLLGYRKIVTCDWKEGHKFAQQNFTCILLAWLYTNFSYSTIDNCSLVQCVRYFVISPRFWSSLKVGTGTNRSADLLQTDINWVRSFKLSEFGYESFEYKSLWVRKDWIPAGTPQSPLSWP